MAKLMSIFPEKSSCEFIFESEKHHDLFCALFPNKKQQARTAAAILKDQTSVAVAPLKERLSCLSELLSEEERRDKTKYLKTLEQLRLSLIVTADQVDFCFSQLFPTPKNTRLKDLLHLYLSTPLKQDLAQCFWEAIGHLKEKRLPSLGVERVFVKAKSSSFLFTEWALAHEYLQNGSSSPIEFWELPVPTISQPLDPKPAWVGSPAAVLTQLAHDIASEGKDEAKQLIAFGGAPHALLFLESKLKSLNILFESLFSHRQETHTHAPVVIFPFQAIPLDPNFKFRSYIDESFYASKEQLFLTEGELFTLMKEGFTIPRVSTDRIYLKTMLTQMQATSSNRFFLSELAPKEDFPTHESLPHPVQTIATNPQELKLPPKKLRLSATQLETYATCPSLYLFRHRLKLKPIQTLEDRYALIFGSATHLALESFLKDPTVTLEALFIRSLESFSSELTPTHPLFTMMVQQFKSLESHFVSLENELKTKFGFKSNISLEKTFEIELEHFSFLGKIDRIIEREDGSHLLIDYKTGNVDFSPNHIIEGSHSQALLYILSVRKTSAHPVAGVLFYDLKKGELRKGIFDESWVSKELKPTLTRGHVLKAENFEKLISDGTSRVLAFSSHIENGNFPPTPTSVECERCEAPTFCRQGLGYV